MDRGLAMLDYFGGTFRHKVDAKGRVSLPSKFRKTLENSGVPGDEIHMIMAQDKSHIVAYLASEVKAKLNTLKAGEEVDIPDVSADDLRRFFFSGAATSPCDGAGRIGLSKSHIRRSEIVKECIFDGMGDYFVIYTEARFVSMKREKDPDYDINEELT